MNTNRSPNSKNTKKSAQKLVPSLLALAGTDKGLWGKNIGKAIDILRNEWNR